MTGHLLCALADAALIVPGSIFVKCAECKIALMMAPSGQRLIARDPTIYPVCEMCFKRKENDGLDWEGPLLADTLEEIEEESRNALPSMRRRRN